MFWWQNVYTMFKLDGFSYQRHLLQVSWQQILCSLGTVTSSKPPRRLVSLGVMVIANCAVTLFRDVAIMQRLEYAIVILGSRYGTSKYIEIYNTCPCVPWPKSQINQGVHTGRDSDYLIWANGWVHIYAVFTVLYLLGNHIIVGGILTWPKSIHRIYPAH